MPKLSELTDVNYTGEYDSMGNALPVEKLYPELQRVYVNEPSVEQPSKGSIVARGILDKLFGQTGERYQLWPEKIVRDALSAAHDVKEGKELSNIGLRREDVTDKPVPQRGDKPDMPGVLTSVAGGILTPTASSPQDSIIEKAQAISALAGTGGLAGGAEGAVLNATPSLRPALKHKERLYKGKPGQEHQDIIPDSLYNDFQKKALAGQDLAEYNFGFINDKGHFMTREDALKYGIDNGIIDPHSGKYGALTTTLLSDSSKPGVAIEAMAKTANPFFSALEHNVANISQGKMNGDAWLGTLSNKPGVKPEELDWTGLRSFLEENKGKPVTKAQIEAHLAENKIELKEVIKGDNPELVRWKELDNKAVKTPAERAEYEQLSRNSANIGEPKYSSYQLPGGENYREVLMTLPKDGRAKFKAQQDEILAKREKLQDEFDALYGKDDAATVSRRKAMSEEFDTLTEDLRKLDLGAAERNNFGDYKSSHWDEPNILAHMRMNDRTIDGKKSLHIEEIQSDWHQAGRDKGYKGDLDKLQKEGLAAADAKIKAQENLDKLTESGLASAAELDAAMKAVRQADADFKKASSAYNAVNESGVPDAPFKKTWHELALKRALREAAEKGYDRLSWTPGEAQAARYDLSKQVDKIAVPMVNGDGTRSVRIDAKNNTPFKLMVDKNGKVQGAGASSDQFSGKPLSDVVGKEMAEKIMKLDKPNEFSGDGLKIGGEGMKGFYDSMIPKAIEKLGKEHGVKVKKGAVENNKEGWRLTPPEHTVSGKWMVKSNDYNSKGLNFDTKAEAEAALKSKIRQEAIFYIDIPQSLRNTATGKGFPLFAKGGYMLQPVDYDPFGEK